MLGCTLSGIAFKTNSIVTAHHRLQLLLMGLCSFLVKPFQHILQTYDPFTCSPSSMGKVCYSVKFLWRMENTGYIFHCAICMSEWNLCASVQLVSSLHECTMMYYGFPKFLSERNYFDTLQTRLSPSVHSLLIQKWPQATKTVLKDTASLLLFIDVHFSC